MKAGFTLENVVWLENKKYANQKRFLDVHSKTNWDTSFWLTENFIRMFLVMEGEWVKVDEQISRNEVIDDSNSFFLDV